MKENNSVVVSNEFSKRTIEKIAIDERKVVEYYTVCKEYLSNLDTKVNEKIKEGWQPVGSLFFFVSGDKRYFVKEMVKYEK